VACCGETVNCGKFDAQYGPDLHIQMQHLSRPPSLVIMARSGRETVGTYEHDYDDLARPQFAVHHHRTRNLISDCRSSSKVNHHVEIHHDGWTRQDYALTRLDHFPRMGRTGLELVLCLLEGQTREPLNLKGPTTRAMSSLSQIPRHVNPGLCTIQTQPAVVVDAR
jgi:hypothetical protein